MINANTVATAGHCVHTGGASGTFYGSARFRVYPGYDLGASSFGSCTVRSTYASNVWGTGTFGNPEYDWGALKLNCNVGNATGFFGFYSKKRLKGQPAIVSGYPGDFSGKQMLGADKIRATVKNRVCYRIDTAGGQSGSPVWNDKQNGLSKTGLSAFAIHTYGVGSCGSTTNVNKGTEITKARIRLFKHIMGL